ncbi:hypothetical protein COB21_01610 [Candidatus Aerophobetes bacterium]|uniref:Uncharacterized protein n=1 Tax=Aerophobetes bacterium TaxID=2030807 RepID=A0A2A4X6J3_UNCAE|nr:MAG: hypothetical protein COB21_01610 [Candidatus Aerophobetes bacterium]
MTDDRMTKEIFTKLYDDDFDLTNAVIAIAREQISHGKDDVKISKILKDIEKKIEEAALAQEANEDGSQKEE